MLVIKKIIIMIIFLKSKNNIQKIKLVRNIKNNKIKMITIYLRVIKQILYLK